MSYIGLFFTGLAVMLVHSGLQLIFVFLMEIRLARKQKVEEDKMIAEMKATGKLPAELMNMMSGGGMPMVSYDQMMGQVPASGTETSSSELDTGQYL